MSNIFHGIEATGLPNACDMCSSMITAPPAVASQYTACS
jgi:hypothetical protein